MSDFNASAEWAAVVAYFDSSAAATRLAALSPRPDVKQGQPEQWEELVAPWLIVVDILGSTQNQAAAAANNMHQQAGTGFRVYCAARGSTLAIADARCLQLVDAIRNDLRGAGGFVGANRTTLIRARWDQWSWDSAADTDLSMAFVDITVDFYAF